MADIDVQTCCSKCLTKRLLHRLYVCRRVEATLRYRFKTYYLKLPPMEPILHRYTRAGPDHLLLSHKSLLQQSLIYTVSKFDTCLSLVLYMLYGTA